MERNNRSLSLILAALLCIALWSPAFAEWTMQEIPLNVRTALKPARGPLKQKDAPKMLARCFYDGQYAGVYYFKVKPGQRYTVEHSFPSDGVWRMVYLMGQTPFTDKNVFTDGGKGYWSWFPTYRSLEEKSPSKWSTKRTNFTVASQSEHNIVYVVAAFPRPDIENYLTIKYPSDSDKTPSVKHNRFAALNEPLLLKKVPGAPDQVSATSPTPVIPDAHKPGPTPATRPSAGTFSLHEAPTSGTNAPVVPYNSKVQAYIGKSDYDTFRVDFQGGLFRASSRGNLDLVADIQDAKGHSIARNGHEGNRNFSLEKSLPAGTYYLCIRVMHHGGEGPYTLILGDGKGNEYKEALK